MFQKSFCVNHDKKEIWVKGTQTWDFLVLRFWILYFFIVSYAKLQIFGNILLCHYWGSYDYSAYTQYTRKKVSPATKVKKMCYKSNVTPFNFVNIVLRNFLLVNAPIFKKQISRRKRKAMPLKPCTCGCVQYIAYVPPCGCNMGRGGRGVQPPKR